jgi:hypothetical protein
LDASWPFANNTWHHVATTGDGSMLRFYLDGVEVSSVAHATSNYSNPASTSPFRIGGLIYSASDYSEAVIDEVVLYERALSASEVSQLYGGTIPQ